MEQPVLKLRLQQETAVFRNPLTTEIIETYPLPPPSTVIGFFLSLLGYLRPARIISNLSIQGHHESMLRDYVWFKRYDASEQQFERQQKPILVHTLLNLSLIIHVRFSEDDTVSKARDSLENHGFLYLGRAEDLVKIDKITWLENNDIQKSLPETSFRLPEDAYVDVETARTVQANGIPYRLASDYTFQEVTIGNRRLMLRECEWVDLRYLERGTTIESFAPLLIDKEGDYIWWFMQNQSPPRV